MWAVAELNVLVARCCAVESFVGTQQVSSPLAESDAVQSQAAQRTQRAEPEPAPPPKKKGGFMSGVSIMLPLAMPRCDLLLKLWSGRMEQLLGTVKVAMGGQTEEQIREVKTGEAVFRVQNDAR